MKTKFVFRLALMLLLSLCLLSVKAQESNATSVPVDDFRSSDEIVYEDSAAVDYEKEDSAAYGDSRQIKENINWAYYGKILSLLFVVGLSVAALLTAPKANWPKTFRVFGGLSFIVCTLSVFGLFFGDIRLQADRVFFLNLACVGFGGFITNYLIAHFLEVAYQVRDDLAAVRASQQGDSDEE